MSIGIIPNPGEEIKKNKPHMPSIDDPAPYDDEIANEEEDEINMDEGILNAREPSKVAEETFENPERILGN